MPQIQITLTPAESKRLIAKAVVAMPEVKKALHKGVVIVGRGTTNACVAEEILGKKIDRDRYVAGVVLPEGTCMVPEGRRLPEVILRDGKVIKAKIPDVLDSMASEDVIIKGANAIDAEGTAGVFIGSVSGGTIGRVIGHVKSRGIQLIMPVGLEKFILGSIRGVAKKVGMFRFDYATGYPVGVMPVSGKVVTELQAVKILAGANATVMGMGGISGAEGSVTLSVKGTAVQLNKLKKIVLGLKRETSPRVKADRPTGN
jgi:hypothetical protein